MRTSKISRDTAKLFERVGSPPRRTTRSLAAKFGYAIDGADGAIKDMEDAVKPAPQKRKGSPLGGRTRTRRAARLKTEAEVDAEVEAPPGWEAVYDAVRRMRAPGGTAHGAAVDTMGCERLADRSASPRDQRFHALIALMLSSQTKDTVNAVVMKRLQTELPAHAPGAAPGLNLENVLAVEADLLNEMIWAVGFHNNKTRYIKQTAEILRDKWAGDIPDSIEGLTSLPGVGPKMAHLCLSVAWDRTEGIGVDVHVHRITNLWGWHRTKNPEETRRALESWLPRDRWREINGLLVGLGQAVCLPVGRRCGDCELAEGGLCRAAEDRGRRGRPKKEAVVGSIKAEVKTEVGVKAEICDAPPALHQIPLSVSTDPPDSKGPVVGVVPAAT